MRKDWEVKRLGDVCISIKDGSHNPPKEIDNSCYIMLSSQNIQDGYIDFNNSRFISEGDFHKEKKRVQIKKGDLLLTIVGTIGRTCVFDGSVDNIVFQRSVAILSPKQDIESFFLRYFIKSQKALLENEAKGVAQKGIYLKQLSDFKIQVPPLQTQQQIVEELDCLTSIIEKQKKQLEELDNLAQAIFYDMFGEPMENEKGWNIKKLEDIVHKNCTLSYGIVQPMEDVVDGVPIVRPIDLIDTFVSDTNLKRTRKEISNKYKRTILTGHEILLCVRGTTGIVSLVNESFAGYNVTRGIVPILLSSLYNRWFVYYQIKTSSIQQKISELTYGIALRQINIKDLRALTLITPPLSLQQQFASKIEAIEKQKELIKKSIKETEGLFNSRMDYYFN